MAGCPWDSRVDAAAALLSGTATSAKAPASAVTTPRIKIRRHANRRAFVELMANPCL